MPKNELDQILKSKIKTGKKRKLLLTQIGYLRINLFSEYYERLQRAERNKEFDKAVKLMDRYIKTIAIPFIPTKQQSLLIKRLKTLLSIDRTPELVEYVQKWKTDYETWLKQTESMPPQMDDKKRKEEFNQLKMTFFTLYTLSFSPHNFPPVAR